MSLSTSRRDFLKTGAAFAAAGGVGRSLADPPDSPAEELAEFDHGAVQLTGGPLKQQYDRIRGAYLALDNDRLLKPYRERAGLPAPGAEMGGWYGPDGFVPGHSLGQYVSGLARFGRTTGDASCNAKVGELVSGFAATLGSKDRIYAGANAEKVWPCYVLDKHLAGLIDAFTLTGMAQARELLPRVLRGAAPYIPEQGRDRVGKKDPPYDETYVLPENLFSSYALTGDRAFQDRAVAYLLDREYFDPLARGEDVLPGRHAYSHAIALSSAAKARLVLGEERYLRSMETAWHFLTTGQQYASGGWGPNETFVAPHQGELYASLQSTEDHFETPCGSYAATKLARYLLRATGDGRYGDGLERVLYNGLLAVKEPDGEGDYPYYSSYSPSAQKVFYRQKWPCCSGTLVQGVSDYVKNIYFRSREGIAINLYTPSQVSWRRNGVPVTLTQETDYPIGEAIELRVGSPAPAAFGLSLRIPGWLEQAPQIHVNGKPEPVVNRRGFALLQRTWRDGDRITLDLRQDFRTEPIDDLHPHVAALMRGPLLYAQRNPGAGEQKLPHLESLRADSDFRGTFQFHAGASSRVFAPFFSIRDERYTTYFEEA